MTTGSNDAEGGGESDDELSRPTLQKNDDDEASYRVLAKTTARLFCINPAGVFFVAAYSESLFAMLTFAGHAVAARGQYYKCLLLLQKDDTTDAPSEPHRGRGGSHWWWANFYWIPSTMLWMLSSYTRSNGTFSSIWWMLVGIAECCSCIITNRRASKRKGTATVVAKCLSALLFRGVLAFFVAYPVYYHDRRGYSFHCPEPIHRSTTKLHLPPAWCEQADTGGGFSLYAHVQRKHWNVGLFRYYEMKQIPNFILALPVLALGFASAVSWIGRSWSRYVDHTFRQKRGDGIVLSAVLGHVFPWAFLSLGASSHDSFPRLWHEKASPTAMKMLLGPKFLPYYAVVTGFAFVGAFLAHVQISTRLIFSSCPAVYWFSSALVTPYLVDDQMGCKGEGRESGRIIHWCAFHTHMLLYFYFALYNLLGIIMHVNWLPWT